MRKYDVLKIIFENPRGITPGDISTRLGVSLPNIYLYLKQLRQDNLVQNIDGRKYAANKTNEKLIDILDLQAMAPMKFHSLLAPDFKILMGQMCAKLTVRKRDLPFSIIKKIESIAIPLRIVLKLSRRPVVYCLKVNEALVSSLLKYHDITPTFSRADFQKLIDKATPGKIELHAKIAVSSPEVIEMCNQLYEAGADLCLSKMEGFIPDQRLGDLLQAATQANTEYALFLNALDEPVRVSIREQWERRYIYNTNRIEGNTMSEDEVNEYLQKSNQPSHISKREIHETNNMKHALMFMARKQKEELSEGLIKDLHFQVQLDIDEHPGEYKQFYNYVKPNSPTTPPQHVQERMQAMIGWYRQNKGTLHPFILASIFHIQFEIIHPFADGNGRVGRLLMNHILQQKNYSPLTIFEKSRQNYYRAIDNRSLPQFLLYILTNFIEEYKRL